MEPGWFVQCTTRLTPPYDIHIVLCICMYRCMHNWPHVMAMGAHIDIPACVRACVALTGQQWTCPATQPVHAWLSPTPCLHVCWKRCCLPACLFFPRYSSGEKTGNCQRMKDSKFFREIEPNCWNWKTCTHMFTGVGPIHRVALLYSTPHITQQQEQCALLS